MNARTFLILESLGYFLGATAALFIAVHYGIPALLEAYALRPVVGWWLTSGVIMVALFSGALLAARLRVNAQSFRAILLALNIRPLTKTDAVWTMGGLLIIIALTGIVTTLSEQVFSVSLLSQDSYASFLRMEKLEPGEYWLFLAWLPYFFFNIVGEELMWRGYLLPRQETALGRNAWILNGTLWAIFHIGIGWRLTIVLLPIEFILPYIVQKRQNTLIGILIHGLYNGSGFVMVALGVVS